MDLQRPTLPSTVSASTIDSGRGHSQQSSPEGITSRSFIQSDKCPPADNRQVTPYFTACAYYITQHTGFTCWLLQPMMASLTPFAFVSSCSVGRGRGRGMRKLVVDSVFPRVHHRGTFYWHPPAGWERVDILFRNRQGGKAEWCSKPKLNQGLSTSQSSILCPIWDKLNQLND